ncbi:hypothetical protein ABMA27_003151 [Loxostege sticticalis]|uniref:Reverse transcriptase domain-containing protein n=1 Tax=Loxostege sticticalis TaxID=481309 RepID=A0ABR3HS56_LOXSC
MWLSTRLSGQNIMIGTAYRPPTQDIELFLDAITESVTSFTKADGLILLGDFNINLLETGSGRCKIFMQCIQSLNLAQLITEPTHFTDHSGTLIDVICTDMRALRVQVRYSPDVGRHAMLLAEFRVRKAKVRPRWVTYRPYRDIILEQLNLDLGAIDWGHLYRSNNINEFVEAFTTCVTGLMDLHAPLKTRKFRHPPHPWITDTVRDMISIRDDYHKRFKQHGTSELRDSYRIMKNMVLKAIEREKTSFFNKQINSNLRNSRLLWKNLKNTVLPNKKNSADLPLSFNDPDLINDHFLNIPGENIVTITAMVNRSILECTFPELWKVAIVKPLPKTSQPTSVQELRPISILPCLSKILERVVCDQLTKYLEKQDILPHYQSGFRKDHGTATALADVVDNLLAAQDRGMVSVMVLLDFSRAFDSINVSLLLSKLTFYGFDSRSVKWFHSYLTGRQQYVELKQMDGKSLLSQSRPVTRGVPQGSILGPILYILYSTDIIQCIKNCRHHLYADDLQMYLSFDPGDHASAVTRVNEDLERIHDWCGHNCLTLNPKKSQLMLFGTPGKISLLSDTNLGIHINGEPIERVEKTRNLGLIFDEHLKFENHITKCTSECFYRLKVLYKLRPYLSEKLRIALCESLILSKLNYCDTVYGPCILKRTASLVQRVQNACARFCFVVPPRSHITPFLNTANMLKMEARRQLHLATLLFGVIAVAKPRYLYEKLEWAVRRPRRLCTYIFSTPKHRTAAFRGSFRFAASRCWNDLPPPLRALQTKGTFKRYVKCYLLSLQKAGNSSTLTSGVCASGVEALSGVPRQT